MKGDVQLSNSMASVKLLCEVVAAARRLAETKKSCYGVDFTENSWKLDRFYSSTGFSWTAIEIDYLRVRARPLKAAGETNGFSNPIGPSEMQG